jgi:hypothetical protein
MADYRGLAMHAAMGAPGNLPDDSLDAEHDEHADKEFLHGLVPSIERDIPLISHPCLIVWNPVVNAS